ncbi:MAG: VanZ family protein [Clostridia bacterium]|nr:VanZ family protein [Clostridia bacterium]
MEKTNKIQRLARVAFALYMLLLVWIIALKCNMRNAILDAKIYNRWFTLAERFEMCLSCFAKTDFEDGAVNVLVFIPLGMLMPFLMRKCAVLKTMVLCFFISTGFEILQIINCIGAFTYIDIINNTAGGIIGAIVYLLLHKKVKEKPLGVAFTVLISILIPTLIAAAVNTVLHVDYYL